VKASAHLVVGRQGEVRQLVPFNLISWHAGASKFQERTGLNRFSIGIEIDNAGRLTKSGEKYVSWFGRKYTADEVIEATHRNETTPSFWHVYEEEQIDCVYKICRALIGNYSISHIVGHEEISPRRKTDPGPAFPLDKLRQRLLVEDRRTEDELGILDQPEEGSVAAPGIKKKGVVTANLLNFRTYPSLEGDLIARPLEQGTTLDVIGEEKDWLKVKVSKTGWVSKKHVRIL
jgi:N-acetylmuramoyl-L-alanine amidase